MQRIYNVLAVLITQRHPLSWSPCCVATTECGQQCSSRSAGAPIVANGVGADEEQPKPADLLPMATEPARVVHVQRRPDIEAVRGGLPITGMEQEVMEAVLQNDVVVLCGETGCGKTTQVGVPATLPNCNHCHFRHDKNHILCATVCISLLCSSVWSSCFCGVTVSPAQ